MRTTPIKITAHNTGWRSQVRFAGSVFGSGVCEFHRWCHSYIMKRTPTSLFTSVALLCVFTSISPFSADAQACRLQIRCSGFTNQGFTVLIISFAPTTNTCVGVRADVEWSDDLKTWHSVALPALPCVTPGNEVQVWDPQDARTRPRRFYRVRHAAPCP